jgi:hypothetical protein
MEGVSWWIGLSREAFYARVREEAERLQKLTNDPKLQPRGPEVKPAVRGGRTPGAEEL